jgi:hypothetical protein
MPLAHVFVETNFLFGIFRMPSQRHRDAINLKMRFEAGEIKLYVPYLCFQEARHSIASTLRIKWWSDLLEFHRFAVANRTATWNLGEVRKLLNAATAEVNRTKAVYQRELAEFAAAVGNGILHGTQSLFEFLESLDLDDDTLQYNDKLILSSVLFKAKELREAGASQLYFASTDKKHLEPTAHRPKMTKYYTEAGLIFLPGFVLPDT